MNAITGKKARGNGRLLDELWQVIESRRGADPQSSHTARLFEKGRTRIARKVGEEAIELIVEALQDNRDDAVEESADLVYHLLVLWADLGIRPEEVCEALAKRRGISGLEEKASRGK